MPLTEAHLYVLANATQGPCWLWEVGAPQAIHRDDRVERWDGVDLITGQAAALDLYLTGLVIVSGERVDEARRYTGETFIANEAEALVALADVANWREPWDAPARATAYSLEATPAGDAALDAHQQS